MVLVKLQSTTKKLEKGNETENRHSGLMLWLCFSLSLVIQTFPLGMKRRVGVRLG